MKAIEYLTDHELEKVVQFNEDLVMKNAVRKVLLEAIYNNGVLRAGGAPEPLRNAAFGLVFKTINGQGVASDADLGQDLRGLANGVSLLEQGLAQLDKIKRLDNTGEPMGNPAI